MEFNALNNREIVNRQQYSHIFAVVENVNTHQTKGEGKKKQKVRIKRDAQTTFLFHLTRFTGCFQYKAVSTS